MEGEHKSSGIFEDTETQIRELMIQSRDTEYTQYLQGLLEHLMKERYQVDLIKVDLERSYKRYLERVGNQKPSEMATKHQVRVPDIAPTEKKTEIKMEEEFPPTPSVSVVEETRAKSNMREKKTVKERKNAEFAVGIAALGIMGGVCILAALVMFGNTYMNKAIKGIAVYVISLSFLAVSEAFLYKKWPKLGVTLSAIGIGGIYLSTALNYFILNNFGSNIALSISVLVTIFTVFFSRKRNTIVYRSIGLVAGYLCLFQMSSNMTAMEFVVSNIVLLGLNLTMVFVPLRETNTGFNVFHMILNTFFCSLYLMKVYNGEESDIAFMFPFLVISAIAIHFSIVVMELFTINLQNRISDKDDSKLTLKKSMRVFYYITTVVLTVILMDSIDANMCEYKLDFNYVYCWMAMVLVAGLVAIMILFQRKIPGIYYIYIALNAMMLGLNLKQDNPLSEVFVLLVLVLIAKTTSFFNQLSLKVNDMIVTIILCASIFDWGNFSVDSLFSVKPEIYVLMVLLLFSIGMIHYWQSAYGIILMSTLVFCVIFYLGLPDFIKLPMGVGIFMVSILYFHHVKWLQGKSTLVYNIYALFGQACCYLALLGQEYQENYLVYVSMLFFGITTILTVFQGKYELNEKYRNFVLSIFLTYMALIFKTESSIVISVLLMIVALVSVGSGFASKQKSVRVYGLILSLFVCGKIVLHDFFDAPTMQKTIMFLVVGVIALTISAIYIVLEKRNKKSQGE